jgi:hypothetical protein
LLLDADYLIGDGFMTEFKSLRIVIVSDLVRFRRSRFGNEAVEFNLAFSMRVAGFCFDFVVDRFYLYWYFFLVLGDGLVLGCTIHTGSVLAELTTLLIWRYSFTENF